MARKILGVIVGSVVMGLLSSLIFSVAYLALGADQAFKLGTYDVSLRWTALSFVVGLVAAIVGGYTCALIARSNRAAQVLAGLALVWGILVAIPTLTGSDTRPNTRPANASIMQAIQNVRTPAWVAILNPIVGVVGVLVGASIRQKTTEGAG